MPTILRDSVNPNSIPAGTPIVGGYVDGLYGLNTAYWNAAAWARWAATGARLRRIAAVTTNSHSNTADFERYDLQPPDGPIWWHNMTAMGETDLWAYVNRSNQQAVEDAMFYGNVPLDKLQMWVATLDGVTKLVGRYRYPIAAVQWIDTGPYDESAVYEVFGPVPVHEEDDMLYAGGFHAKAVPSLRVFTAGASYHDPAATALQAGSLTINATVAVDGYRYTNSPVQSPDLGNGQPGPDFVWWHATSGQWVPDAILDTSALAGAPAPGIPSGEPLSTYFAPAGGGSGPDDDSAYATVAQLNQVQATIPTKATTTLAP